MNEELDLTLADYQALAELRYQMRCFLHFSEQAARSVGLEPQQHQLLLALKASPEGQTAIGDLAKRLQLQDHSTLELSNRMVTRGLLQRQRDQQDQRRVLITLTTAGEAILQQLTLLHRTELRSTGPELVRALQTVVKGNHLAQQARAFPRQEGGAER